MNGIDGFVSTVLGIAAGSERRATVALIGDLCFLHDTNGLLGAADRGVDATFVVVDNGGGGIFSFLPQAELPEHFETLFGTPQPVDLAALAAVHGIPVAEVDAADDLVPAVQTAIDAGGVRVVRVRTDRDANVARHREVWAAVANSLARSASHLARIHCRRAFAERTPGRAVSVKRQGRTSARSIGSSLAWVSAHSASGSEPATMPAPATRRARLPSSSAPRSAIAHSPSPRASTQPTGPA